MSKVSDTGIEEQQKAGSSESGSVPVQYMGVTERIEHIRGLKKDWDSYDAPPIPNSVVRLALAVVEQMKGTPHVIVGAGPTNDEGIQLDTQSGMGIEVSKYGN